MRALSVYQHARKRCVMVLLSLWLVTACARHDGSALPLPPSAGGGHPVRTLVASPPPAMTLASPPTPIASPTTESGITRTPAIQPPSRPTPHRTAHDLATQWLRSVPCAPPCWEGITPGMTTLSETLDLLGQNPAIDAIRVQRSAVEHFSEIHWSWVDDPLGGLIVSDDRSGMVQLIDPSFPAVRYRQVAAAFGEPSAIRAQSGRGPDYGSPLTYGFSVIYEAQGMVFASGDHPAFLLDDPWLIGPVFFAHDYFFQADTRMDYRVPWQGRQPFDFYCRDPFGGVCER